MNKFIVIDNKNLKLGYYFEDNKLSDIRCYEEGSILGNIYVGRVSNILNNINAVFIDIMPGLSCYMSLEDYKGENKLKMGDILPVQISKDSIKTKQPSVTTDISLTGEYVIIHSDSTVGVSSKIKDNQVRDNLKALFKEVLSDFEAEKKCKDITYGAVIRTKTADSENVSTQDIKKEMLELLKKLDDMLSKAAFMSAYSVIYKNEAAYLKDMCIFSKHPECEVITDSPEIYNEFTNTYNTEIKLYNDEMISLTNLYNLKSLTEKALSKRAYLKSGAYLVIEHTEAMTVIDVNSGKAIKGRNSEENIYKINCEAAMEIARQLKLRNISGIIIVDFISMKNESLNQNLLNELKDFTKNDFIPVNVIDITRLGLVELTRKKVRKPLHEMAHLIKY